MRKITGDLVDMYKRLAQNLPNTSVVMFDRDMRYTLAEGTFVQRIVPDKEAILGKLPNEILPPESVSFLSPIYQRILSGESFSFERETSHFSYQAYASPVKSDEGDVVGGMILAHDMTDSKRTETALRASEARFHSLVDLAPVGIIQTDAQGKRVFCNTYWCEMAGVTLEDALNDTEARTVHPDDWAKADEAWEAMMETKLPFANLVFRYQRPDGSSIWVSGSGRPLFDNKGTVTGYLGSVSNIDEQVRAQTALRESEERYRSLIDAMSEGVVLQGKDGKIQTCNPAAERILGLTADQMMGRTSMDPMWRAVHDDGSPFPGETHPVVVTLRTGIPESNVIMGVHKPDGSLSWLAVNSRPLFTDDPHKPSAVVATFVDITGIRETQQSLSRERDLLRTVIDNTPDYIFLKDTEARFVLSNIAHTRAAGKSATDEIVGKTAFDLFLPELATQFYADDQSLMHSGESLINAERETVDADGNQRTVLTTKIPWRDSNGYILGLIGISRDITVRKRLENTLRQNEERLRLITDNIYDLVTLNDTKGKFIFVSPSCSRMLGHEPESLLGIESSDLIHPDDRDLMNRTMQEAIQSHSPHFVVECRLRHAEGYYIWSESVVTFIYDEQANITGGVFVARDITERKILQQMRLEHEILQADLKKEQELGTLKTLMMQRIAHEFRTPLTIIQSSVETITRFLERLTPEQRATRVEAIERQIQSITDMLDQIGLVINGNFKPDRLFRERTDFCALCREVAAELETQLHQPGRYQLELPAIAVIQADKRVLKNALLHVMRNAARFSPATAVVRVQVKSVHQAVELSVTDTGIGILPNEQPRIFEPFFRGSNLNEVGGLGVGLSIAQAAIEAHGGSITVESVPKQGTTVTIQLPV